MIPDSNATSFLRDMLLTIFAYLDPDELAVCGSVCKRWKRLSEEPSLWRRFFDEIPQGDVNLKQVVMRKIQSERYQGIYPINNQLYLVNGFKFKVSPQRQPSIPAVIDYPSHFGMTRITSFCAYTNFTKEEIPTRSIKFLTGSVDCLLKLWSVVEVENRHFQVKCLATMIGHHKPITHIKMRNDFIFTASEDQTIKIWKIFRNQNLLIYDIKCIETVSMPRGRISSLIPLGMDFQRFSFYVGIENRIERHQVDEKSHISRQIFSPKSNDRITVLCLATLKQNILFSGTETGEIYVWQTELSGRVICCQKIMAHAQAVTALASHSFNKQLISGSASGEICIWEKKKENEPWELKFKATRHYSPISQIKYIPHLGHFKTSPFFCLSKDNTIVGYEYFSDKSACQIISHFKGFF